MKMRAFAAAAFLALGGSLAAASIVAVQPSITVGDKTFSDFTFSGNVDPASIQVLPISGPDIGVEFKYNWNSTDGNNQDTTVSYKVHVNDPSRSIIGVGLHFDGNTTGNTNLLTAATVTETVDDSGGTQIGKLSVFNAGPMFSMLNRNDAFVAVAPTQDLTLTKDIMVHSPVLSEAGAGIRGMDAVTFGSTTATISLVDNTFRQTSSVPLPSSAAMGIVSIGLGAFAPLRRKLRQLIAA